MLVLSRRKDESVAIGHNGEIVVTLLSIRGNKVRLGVTAPRDLPVHRMEVRHAISAKATADEVIGSKIGQACFVRRGEGGSRMQATIESVTESAVGTSYGVKLTNGEKLLDVPGERVTMLTREEPSEEALAVD